MVRCFSLIVTCLIEVVALGAQILLLDRVLFWWGKVNGNLCAVGRGSRSTKEVAHLISYFVLGTGFQIVPRWLLVVLYLEVSILVGTRRGIVRVSRLRWWVVMMMVILTVSVLAAIISCGLIFLLHCRLIHGQVTLLLLVRWVRVIDTLSEVWNDVELNPITQRLNDCFWELVIVAELACKLGRIWILFRRNIGEVSSTKIYFDHEWLGFDNRQIIEITIVNEKLWVVFW